MSSTQFDIEAFFAQYGQFDSVRLRRAEPPEKVFKGSVFVEWSNKETAEKFMTVKPEPQWKGHPLHIMWKLDYMKQKSEAIREGKINASSRKPARGSHRGQRGHSRGHDVERTRMTGKSAVSRISRTVSATVGIITVAGVGVGAISVDVVDVITMVLATRTLPLNQQMMDDQRSTSARREQKSWKKKRLSLARRTASELEMTIHPTVSLLLRRSIPRRERQKLHEATQTRDVPHLVPSLWCLYLDYGYVYLAQLYSPQTN